MQPFEEQFLLINMQSRMANVITSYVLDWYKCIEMQETELTGFVYVSGSEISPQNLPHSSNFTPRSEKLFRSFVLILVQSQERCNTSWALKGRADMFLPTMQHTIKVKSSTRILPTFLELKTHRLVQPLLDISTFRPHLFKLPSFPSSWFLCSS